MTKNEALKLALKALERGETELRWQAITAIKEALAQPEQEPVAWYYKEGLERGVSLKQETFKWIPLYTTPPQPKEPEQEPEWYHGVDEHGCNRFYHKTEVRPSEFKTPLYTTPPQRKPPQFPTMLRKMWSGSEVQDWINDNWNRDNT